MSGRWGIGGGGPREQARGYVLQGSRALSKAGRVTVEPLPDPCPCDLMAGAVCLRGRLRDPAPIIWLAWGTWGPVGSWVPGSLRDDSWTGSGNLALRELPTDIGLLSQDWDLGGWKLCLGILPFLVRTERNIHLVEIYGNILNWPWPELKNKGCDTKKFAKLIRKGLRWKLSGSLGVFKWPVCLHGPAVNLSLFQTLTFCYCLFSVYWAHGLLVLFIVVV